MELTVYDDPARFEPALDTAFPDADARMGNALMQGLVRLLIADPDHYRFTHRPGRHVWADMVAAASDSRS